MAFLVSLFFAFVPTFFMAVIIYWLDRYEKEPLVLLGAAFFWGAVVAAGGAFVANTIFGLGIYALTGSGDVADQATETAIMIASDKLLARLRILRDAVDDAQDAIAAGGIGELPLERLHSFAHGTINSQAQH